MRVTRVETAIVSLPFAQPIVTPIHRISAIDNVLVTLHTDEGPTGIAYLWAFGESRARVLAAMVADLAPQVLGSDPDAVEATWTRMWNDVNFLGRAGVAMFALSALDIALWDLRGKRAGVSLCRLLGAPPRPVRAYANGLFLSTPIDALVAEARGYIASGFRAMKMRTGAAALATDIERVEAVRAAIGPEAELMIDVVQGWSPPQAIEAGLALARFRPAWIEDPVAFDDLAGMARVAAALDIPIAAGENDYSRTGFTRLLDARAADILMPDLQRVGGISEWCRVAELARVRGLSVTPHVFHEISTHLVVATPNAEYVEHVSWWDDLFDTPPAVVAGMAVPSDRPGLGLAFAWDRLDRYRAA